MNTGTNVLLLQGLDALYKTSPYIAVKLETNWGCYGTHKYLKKLLIKDRPFRHGFPKNDYFIIMQLYFLHVSLYGNFNDTFTLEDANISIL
jgi:hypothetical protein